MIVDDTPSDLEVLYEIVGNQGWQAIVATDGKSAIEQANYAKPDLILLDVMMKPGIDGFETCRQLKANPHTQEIPVIFITGMSYVKDKILGFQLGAVDYITKPFQFQEVEVRISCQLMIRQQKQILEQERELLQQEIERRKKAENLSNQSRALIHSIITNSSDGIAALEAIRDSQTGKIKDFRCLVINPEMA